MYRFTDCLCRLMLDVKTFLMMKSEVTMLQRLMIAAVMLAHLLCTRPSRGAEDAIILNLNAEAQTVNVMGRAMPKIPVFPKLERKPGKARGYVKDAQGRPLKGAVIGVRSTAAGGFYSGASAKSDENGYYEVTVPAGVAHYYCAGYAVDYGEGRLALGLHPADGEADSFASPEGAVENWVVLPYGIADREGIQENPRYCNNYYGGTVILSYDVDSDERFPDPKKMPLNSVIEITFTPEGALIDGTPSRPIVLRKSVGSSWGQLYVNNIPAGSYQIRAKLVNGDDLSMSEIGPNRNAAFGISPKKANGTASLLLRPSSGKPNMAVAARGNWDQIMIALERP
jgi:hypothetical protein